MKFSTVTALICLFCLLTTPFVYGDQVKLEVSMANPVLVVGQKQVTYLKVGLTGFEFKKKQERTPVNVAIVIDRSGSMSGRKIQKAREAAIMAVNRLGSNDIISVVAYESTVQVLIPATKISDRSMIIDAINRISAGGSTALFAGVTKGVQEVRKFYDKNRVNRVILLSDGLANVGPSSPGELGELGTSLGRQGISVTTVGIGTGYNEDLMTVLAKNSGGNHGFAETAADLITIFNYEFSDVLSVVAQEVVVKIQCATGIRPIRVMGRDADFSGQTVIAAINQLYSKQEKYILLELEVPASKIQTLPVATVEISYANMQTKTTDALSSKIAVRFSKSAEIVAKSTNKKVVVAAITQIANDNNRKALELRDKGKIKEAKQMLQSNIKYINNKLQKYDSKVLRKLKRYNDRDVQNLAPDKWRKNRKMMRKSQYEMETQQKW